MADENRPHLVRGLIKGVLYTFVLLAVLLVALTQTQVGREGLKTELERQFDRQFQGQITIGKLSGNLVYDLYGSDVVLIGVDGEHVASVDSIVARPSWLSLLDGGFNIRSLTLHRPVLTLSREADADWNLTKALAPRGEPAEGDAEAYGIDLPRTSVINGEVTVADHRPGSFVSQRDLNGRLHVTSVTGDADISWHSDTGLLLNIAALSANLPSLEQSLRSFSGEITLDDNALHLGDTHLALLNTDLEISGSWSFFEDGPQIDASFNAETLDFDELRPFFPDLPVYSQVTASGDLSGTWESLSLDDIHVQREASQVHSNGILHVSDETISYTAESFEADLQPNDVQDVLPELGRLLSDRTGYLEGSANGEVSFSRYGDDWVFRDADLDLAASSGSGQANGLFALYLNGEDWRYNFDLHSSELNLGQLIPEIFPSTLLSGEIVGSGYGPLEAVYGDVRAELEDSHIGPYAFSHFSVEAEADSGVVLGNTRIAYGAGSMVTQGQLDLRERADAYFLNSQLYDFDLQAFSLHDSLSTELNGSIAQRGSGFSTDGLFANLSAQLDSSSVMWGDQVAAVHPQELDVSLSTYAGTTEFDVVGDAVSLQLQAGAGLQPFTNLTAYWLDIADREFERYLADDQVTPTDEAPISTDWVPETESDLQLDIEIRDGELLGSLFPLFPTFGSDIRANVGGQVSGEALALTGDYYSSYFHLAPLESHGMGGVIDIQAEQQNGRGMFSTSVTSQADSARIGGQLALRNPFLQYNQQGQDGILQLTSASRDQTGPLHALADVRLRRNGSTLHFQEFAFESGHQDWSISTSEPIVFSSSHIAIASLELTSASPQQSAPQHLALSGTLSSSPEDSLLVSARELQINPTTGFSLLGRPVDGFASGTFVMRAGLGQPRITGSVLVDNLSFDDRLLGQLELHSSYQPGTPDVAIQANLHSIFSADALRLTPDQEALIPSDNELSLAGSIRLPGVTESRDAPDPGAFDLDVDVRRAEVFIFEYIFQDLITQTDGHLSGDGHIGGDFHRPVFDANLDAVDGSFSIPEFNLTYDIDGNFQVDREGIAFNNVLLTDRREGQAMVDGRLEFNEYQYFSFDIAAELDEIQIIDVRNSRVLPFYGTIAVSGPAYLTGPLHDAYLRAPSVRTTAGSDLFIPVTDEEAHTDEGFLIFADQQGRLPDLSAVTQRRSVLSDRPLGERTFLNGLSMDLNIDAPTGSTVHLVFDPLLGDAMTGQGSGRIQLQRQEGEISTYGTFNVTAGEYLFTAGELFFRRFRIDEGTIQWDGNPVDAQLDITASYHTRASAAGLSDAISSARGRIPLVVQMHIQNRVSQPSVDLSLAIDRSDRTLSEDYAASALETVLNQTERETEYATSVLLTNTFLLTTELEGAEEGRLTDTGNRLAFNSLSQLVGSQLNRYLSEALPNVDVLLDVQGENPQDLDVIYGVALRLMDERLIIRGEGVWTDNEQRAAEGMEGEFIVELRFSPSVSVEAFHRREGSLLAEQVLMSTTGAGVSYQTQFPTWKEFIYRLFGWEIPGESYDGDEDNAIATRE